MITRSRFAIALLAATVSMLSARAYAVEANCPAWTSARCTQWKNEGDLAHPRMVCQHYDCVADKASDPPKRALDPTNPPPRRGGIIVDPVRGGGLNPMPPGGRNPIGGIITPTGGLNPGSGGGTTIYRAGPSGGNFAGSFGGGSHGRR